MYIFVRIHAFIIMVLGILLMLLGLFLVVFGFFQNTVLLHFVNNTWLTSVNLQMVDARFYSSALGLGLFLFGLMVSASGQLLLVFADVAANTKETNQLLRRMRKADDHQVVYAPYVQPVVVQPAQVQPVEVRPAVAPPAEVLPAA